MTYNELKDALFMDKLPPFMVVVPETILFSCVCMLEVTPETVLSHDADIPLSVVVLIFVIEACILDRFGTETYEFVLPIYVFCGLPVAPSVFIHKGMYAWYSFTLDIYATHAFVSTQNRMLQFLFVWPD